MIPNLHGDLGLIPVKVKTPKTAKKAKIHILQASEVTGNRHEVYGKEIFRWTKDGKEYISSKTPYHIRHIGGDAEHGVQPVEAGTREVRHEEEYDPWKNELKIVVD
jgi:hypothetical protein